MTTAEKVQLAAELVPLGPWLECAERAGIPFVPATFSAPFPVMGMYYLLDRDEALSSPAKACRDALEWAEDLIEAQIDTGHRPMFRFECCSMYSLKYAAAQGKDYGAAYREVLLDDPRVFDCTIGKTTRVCVRPWFTAHRYQEYPIEFRVFHDGRDVLGLSNYYPQRDLPEDNPLIQQGAALALEYANRLSVTKEFPVGFTADFLLCPTTLAPYFQAVFLEGGPPHWEGYPSAHPCCFAPGKIDGTALSKRPGALER